MSSNTRIGGLQMAAQPASPNTRKANLERNLVAAQQRYDEALEQVAAYESNTAGNNSNVPKEERLQQARMNAERLSHELEMANRRFRNAPGTTPRVKAPAGFLEPRAAAVPAAEPAVAPAAATAAEPTAEPGYPDEATLKKKYTMNLVPIYFNIKNGQFKVKIPRAAGTKGALEICSPSLKGIRDTLIEDAVSTVRQPVSTFGKLFGKQRGGTTRRRAAHKQRSTRRH